MDAFPAFFPLAGRTVVVAGEGDFAEAKARLFDGSPAEVRRLATPEPSPEAYRGAVLVFIAAGSKPERAAAAAAARLAGAIVNVVDHPDLSDFITPALVDRGAVVAAVGTTGSAPLLAAMLRSDLEARIPEGAGRVAALFGAMREKLRELLPDLDARRAFLREALTGPAAAAAMKDDMPAARRLLRKALDEWAARGRREGRVTLIVDPGEADRLSLRAARTLSQADVLVAEDGATPGVLALARREARRLSAAEAGADALTLLAADGLQVVWVGAGERLDLAALSTKSVAVERLAPAPP